MPGFFGLVILSVRALLTFVFLLVWCFGGSGMFFFNSLRHLGIVFSSLLCPHAASSTSCLGPIVCPCGVAACLFKGTVSGFVWVWPRGRGQHTYIYIYIYLEGIYLRLNPKCDERGSFFGGSLILLGKNDILSNLSKF